MADSTVRRASSVWETIDLTTAPAEGPVAFGDVLSPQRLFTAYQHGMYPFPAGGVEHQLINEMTYESAVDSGRIKLLPGSHAPYSVAWCSPDPRPLIFTDQAHVQRSLRQQLRNKVVWTTTMDTCFERVVLQCREGRAQSWLSDELLASLCALHEHGHAHSVEVWDGEELIGGTFGVQIGAVFSADSQFTVRSGAGKVAVADLARRFADIGGVAIDVQHDSDHVRLMGARPVPRSRYLELLRIPMDRKALSTELMPARRLAE